MNALNVEIDCGATVDVSDEGGVAFAVDRADEADQNEQETQMDFIKHAPITTEFPPADVVVPAIKFNSTEQETDRNGVGLVDATFHLSAQRMYVTVRFPLPGGQIPAAGTRVEIIGLVPEAWVTKRGALGGRYVADAVRPVPVAK